MEKHLLVAVSEQQSAMYGIRFVSHFFINKDNLKLTLFYTAPKTLCDWGDQDSYKSAHKSTQLSVTYEQKGRQALETAKNKLIQTGFKQTQIDTKLLVRKISKVMDIINEGEKGLYDAVILGRRGLSWLSEAFEDSVSKELMGKRFNFPIWLCKGSTFHQNNVLLCLDGSDASYRAADHVGFVLQNETAHEVTLLIVNRQNEKSAESIIAKGREYLTNNGFPSQKIKEQVVISDKVAETIFKVALNGQFSAVALGRKRAEKSLLNKMFKSSVNSKLLRELEQSALLICH